MPKSWKPEVKADNTGQWYPNGVRFATKEESDAYVRNLAGRWLAVYETRSVESDDPVNYAWVEGKGLMPVGEEVL